MKIMCLPGYHRSGFVANHALGGHVPKCMSCHKAIVVINIYIFIYLFIVTWSLIFSQSSGNNMKT